MFGSLVAAISPSSREIADLDAHNLAALLAGPYRHLGALLELRIAEASFPLQFFLVLPSVRGDRRIVLDLERLLDGISIGILAAADLDGQRARRGICFFDRPTRSRRASPSPTFLLG